VLLRVASCFRAHGGQDLTGQVTTVADPAVTVFPDWTFTTVAIPLWPVARVPQPPFAQANVFAVDAKGNLTTVGQLEQFFKDHAPRIEECIPEPPHQQDQPCFGSVEIIRC
jgi:hypothetical protein